MTDAEHKLLLKVCEAVWDRFIVRLVEARRDLSAEEKDLVRRVIKRHPMLTVAEAVQHLREAGM